MSAQFPTRDDATAFRAAISQWQLAARTEVKRSSSLPSSMFDACDPMLEARLAESVEAMMHCLHQPPEATTETPPTKLLPARVETVEPNELSALQLLLKNDDAALDLESGVSAEYLGLLIDTCTTADESVQAAARALLQQDFAIAATADLQQASAALLQCLRELTGTDADDPKNQAQLAELCGAIAASVILETHKDQEAP